MGDVVLGGGWGIDVVVEHLWGRVCVVQSEWDGMGWVDGRSGHL